MRTRWGRSVQRAQDSPAWLEGVNSVKGLDSEFTVRIYVTSSFDRLRNCASRVKPHVYRPETL